MRFRFHRQAAKGTGTMYRHRQLHLWITDNDYSLLRNLADERRETLSSVIRRLIKIHHTGPGDLRDQVIGTALPHAESDIAP